MNTTDMGRLGESLVMARLVELGWYPFVDISGKCPVDIIAWKGGETRTFQVKTTSYKQANSNKYCVQIGRVRPNRTGNAVHKFDVDGADYLAICVAPEKRVVFVKSSTITAGRMLTVQSTHSDNME